MDAVELFKFQQLPYVCKLKIFSLLSLKEHGIAAQVCHEWHVLMKEPRVWGRIDLTSFPSCTVRSRYHVCSEKCYLTYKCRMQKFLCYLVAIRPIVTHLRFAFDIGEAKDGWLPLLKSLIQAIRGDELLFAQLNWQETSARLGCIESRTWTINDFNEVVHRYRHVQRLFVSFFELFVHVASNVSTLILPFDYSDRSIRALSHLRYVTTLVLQKYFSFQTLPQNSLTQLCAAISRVRKLIMELWTPSGRGLSLYHLTSEALEYLDVSQCRGFYLGSLCLPSLKVLLVSRHPWNGPLVNNDNIEIPCLYQVLAYGAPNLQQLNEHRLRDDWKTSSYSDLETVLSHVCSCRFHKSSWAV